jgi:septum formation protein
VKTTTSPLILASSSPYRKALLERLGLPFAIMVPSIDETPRLGEAPAELALRLAELKARAAVPAHPAALIIGSDQVAEFSGAAIGKPRDRTDALEMLRTMRGRSIVFHTALALLNARSGRLQLALVDVASTFRTLDDAALEAYVDTDQPYDCAGAVRAETLGIALFTRIASDDPTALIGLPLIRLTDMLLSEGVRPV